jgi:glycine/D-amino acid oxidase-like deaminating enzyme
MSDVVVIGAGVVGSAVAYRLARSGARVMVVDQAAPGQGTSANSFAWVNANNKPPRAYHRLNAESVTAHRRLHDDVAAEMGTAPWLHETGGLEWANTAAGRDQLLAKAERLRDWGYRIDVIDSAQAQALEPHLRLHGLTAATFCPDEAWVEGPRFAADVCTAAGARGAVVRTGEAVAGIERGGGRVTGVRLTSGERIAADWVVLAAGRWTDRVAALAGVEVPLAPTCGLLAVTSPIEHGVSRVVHVPGMNFRPDPSGGLVLQSGPTDATVTADTAPDPALPGCAELLRRVQQFLPGLAGATIAEARVGVRPMPADGYSIVGPVDGRAGLYLAVTHSGVTLSPLLGELVAAEITTGRPDERLADFRPGRCVRVGGVGG